MAAKKLLILGATGRTGRRVLERALQEGYDVTVLVRQTSSFAGGGAVRVVLGSATDSGALDQAATGQDVVISTLGVPGFTSGGLISRAAPAIVHAMERHGVRRLIFTSAYGVGATWKDVPLVPRLFIRLLLRDVYADKLDGEAAIEPSGLDWTIVHPTGLTDKAATGSERVGERLNLIGFPTVSRSAVAALLVAQIEDGQYLRKHVLISA